MNPDLAPKKQLTVANLIGLAFLDKISDGQIHGVKEIRLTSNCFFRGFTLSKKQVNHVLLGLERGGYIEIRRRGFGIDGIKITDYGLAFIKESGGCL
ncbi:MAG: hypothetical protein NTU57_00310 [Candidatus Aenigmarchaeota archaeon]|nr:hypothetical protein [Candidatus Aenigmarchaeota archaeon]